MGSCEECIVFQIHHHSSKPSHCKNCGQDTLEWSLIDGRTICLICSNCGNSVLVDLNTPCEIDPIFRKKTIIIVHPQQKLPDHRSLITLSRHFHCNSLQMREKLINGFSFEIPIQDQKEDCCFLEKYDIDKTVISPGDPRIIYTYYKKCNYYWSNMDYCKYEDSAFKNKI